MAAVCCSFCKHNELQTSGDSVQGPSEDQDLIKIQLLHFFSTTYQIHCAAAGVTPFIPTRNWTLGLTAAALIKHLLSSFQLATTLVFLCQWHRRRHTLSRVVVCLFSSCHWVTHFLHGLLYDLNVIDCIWTVFDNVEHSVYYRVMSTLRVFLRLCQSLCDQMNGGPVWYK